MSEELKMDDDFVIEITDPRWNFDGVTIDCMVTHPELGWIPYTASPNSVGEFPEAVWAKLQTVDVAPRDDDAALKRAQDDSIRKLNAAYEDAAEELTRFYPDTEMRSWPMQQFEATAYRAWEDAGSEGDAPATPTLDALLLGRNGADGTETLSDLVDKVYTLAQQFIAWQFNTGIRQRGERMILDATTPDTARAITWASLTQQEDA